MLVLLTELYPALAPVTRTDMVFDKSAELSVYVEAVPPEMTVPDRSHWYFRVVPVVHVPGTAVSLDPTDVVPDTLGVGAESVPALTAAVALLVLEVEAYPALAPVIRTEIALAASAPTSVYAEDVAPEIAAPDRNHWYFKVTGAGFHVPGEAVSLDPTFAVPETVGTGAVTVPSGTLTVALLALVTLVYPDFVPVTFTLKTFDASAPTGVYVDDVAPLIAVPDRSHWYFKITGAGFHVPGVAVSLDPIFTVPLTAGTGAVSVPAAVAVDTPPMLTSNAMANEMAIERTTTRPCMVSPKGTT